ncbi:MAG: hypothetical protein AAGA61_08065 [Pseudomonadota bacterium]
MPSPGFKKNVDILRSPAWVCFVWFGLTVGAGLLAVLAIFAAEAASRAVSLDVARTVFEYLGKAELMLLVLLLILVRASGQAARLWAACAVLALITLAQAADSPPSFRRARIPSCAAWRRRLRLRTRPTPSRVSSNWPACLYSAL